MVFAQRGSDRAFRFENVERMLRKDNRQRLSFFRNSILTITLGWKSAVIAVKRTSSVPVLVMIPVSQPFWLSWWVTGHLLSLIRNGHTIAALVMERRWGSHEHHTHTTPKNWKTIWNSWLRWVGGKSFWGQRAGGHYPELSMEKCRWSLQSQSWSFKETL